MRPLPFLGNTRSSLLLRYAERSEALECTSLLALSLFRKDSGVRIFEAAFKMLFCLILEAYLSFLQLQSRQKESASKLAHSKASLR